MQAQLLDETAQRLKEAIEDADEEVRKEYFHRLYVSWIYHDSALEGVVYTMDELTQAMKDEPPEEASAIPVYDEIVHNRHAIGLVKDWANKKRFQVALDVIKKLYGTLAPEELEGRAPPRYRKDMPLHRMYFHEIAPPDKISYRMRQLVAWANNPETKRSMHVIRLAAKMHHTLLHIYPFPKLNGKVARLMMNVLLLRGGYPPVVVHATERQRYYDALKTSDNAVANLVADALKISMDSALRYFRIEAEARGGRRARPA